MTYVDKPTSLLLWLTQYDRKKFYNTGPRETVKREIERKKFDYPKFGNPAYENRVLKQLSNVPFTHAIWQSGFAVRFCGRVIFFLALTPESHRSLEPRSKHFIFLIAYKWVQYAPVFVPDKHFQKRIIYNIKSFLVQIRFKSSLIYKYTNITIKLKCKSF